MALNERAGSAQCEPYATGLRDCSEIGGARPEGYLRAPFPVMGQDTKVSGSRERTGNSGRGRPERLVEGGLATLRPAAASRTPRPLAMRACARRSFSRVMTGRCPPVRPRTLADEVALELPEGGEQWNTSRSSGVVVSTASVSERNPTPRRSNAATVSIRCGRLRPSRSSFQVTSTSPARAVFEHLGAACRGQRVEWQGQALVRRAYPGVADRRYRRSCPPRRRRARVAGHPGVGRLGLDF